MYMCLQQYVVTARNIGGIWQLDPKWPLCNYWQILIWQFGTGLPYIYWYNYVSKKFWHILIWQLQYG